jgi:inhibitor of growth protein 4
MNIFDTFDKIIENVQQIPLDIYLFKKENRRIRKKISNLTRRMRKLQNLTIKTRVDHSKKIEETYRKLKKYNKKEFKNIEKINNVLLRIYEKDHALITEEQPSLQLQSLNIENINRVVKINKMLVSGPTYCSCKQKAYDSMIACNNIECKYKWFHFECIGISNTPKNIWYCQDCRKTHK